MEIISALVLFFGLLHVEHYNSKLKEYKNKPPQIVKEKVFIKEPCKCQRF